MTFWCGYPLMAGRGECTESMWNEAGNGDLELITGKSKITAFMLLRPGSRKESIAR